MATIIAFFLTKVGRIVGAVAGAIALIFIFGQYKEGVGRRELIAESREAGKEANAKSQEHHNRAHRPGAADRLRKDSCRDC